MAYQLVRVLTIEEREAATGAKYLRCRLSVSPPRTAWCWDKDLWTILRAAHKKGEGTMLDLIEKDAPGIGPLLNIVGYEHPGQGKLFT